MKAEEYIKILERVAERRGWKLNPDKEILLELAKGLLKNRERYGLAYCPCRIVVGKKEIDRKIVCPCVYAEEDIKDYGRCYCALYVDKEVFEGKKKMPPVIPDRHAEFLFTSSK